MTKLQNRYKILELLYFFVKAEYNNYKIKGGNRYAACIFKCLILSNY